MTGCVTTPLLEVNGLKKFYGPVRALEGASLSVTGGEVVALCGDNGAGKSTLIKILSGALSPDAGRILFHGEEVKITCPVDATKLGIQVVYQDLALCDNLDIVANMFLGSEKRGPAWRGFRLARPEMERAALATLESLGARPPAPTTSVSVLSGGQRQSAAVGRAILGTPRVVILDEPTAALGVTQTDGVLRCIDRLRAQGKAVLMVSHALPDVLTIADRIVVLRLGRTVADRERAAWTEHSLVAAITGTDARVAGEPANVGAGELL